MGLSKGMWIRGSGESARPLPKAIPGIAYREKAFKKWIADEDQLGAFGFGCLGGHKEEEERQEV